MPAWVNTVTAAAICAESPADAADGPARCASGLSRGAADVLTTRLCAGALNAAPGECYVAAPVTWSDDDRVALCMGSGVGAAACAATFGIRTATVQDAIIVCHGTTNAAAAACYTSATRRAPSHDAAIACAAARDIAPAACISAVAQRSRSVMNVRATSLCAAAPRAFVLCIAMRPNALTTCSVGTKPPADVHTATAGNLAAATVVCARDAATARGRGNAAVVVAAAACRHAGTAVVGACAARAPRLLGTTAVVALCQSPDPSHDLGSAAGRVTCAAAALAAGVSVDGTVALCSTAGDDAPARCAAAAANMLGIAPAAMAALCSGAVTHAAAAAPTCARSVQRALVARGRPSAPRDVAALCMGAASDIDAAARARCAVALAAGGAALATPEAHVACTTTAAAADAARACFAAAAAAALTPRTRAAVCAHAPPARPAGPSLCAAAFLRGGGKVKAVADVCTGATSASPGACAATAADAVARAACRTATPRAATLEVGELLTGRVIVGENFAIELLVRDVRGGLLDDAPGAGGTGPAVTHVTVQDGGDISLEGARVKTSCSGRVLFDALRVDRPGRIALRFEAPGLAPVAAWLQVATNSAGRVAGPGGRCGAALVDALRCPARGVAMPAAHAARTDVVAAAVSSREYFDVLSGLIGGKW